MKSISSHSKVELAYSQEITEQLMRNGKVLACKCGYSWIFRGIAERARCPVCHCIVLLRPPIPRKIVRYIQTLRYLSKHNWQTNFDIASKGDIPLTSVGVASKKLYAKNCLTRKLIENPKYTGRFKDGYNKKVWAYSINQNGLNYLKEHENQ